MNKEEIRKAIAEADAMAIEEYLDVALNRKRELYPNWDIWYYAEPKENEEKELDDRLRSLMWVDFLLLLQQYEKIKGQPGWEETLKAML